MTYLLHTLLEALTMQQSKSSQAKSHVALDPRGAKTNYIPIQIAVYIVLNYI